MGVDDFMISEISNLCAESSNAINLDGMDDAYKCFLSMCFLSKIHNDGIERCLCVNDICGKAIIGYRDLDANFANTLKRMPSQIRMLGKSVIDNSVFVAYSDIIDDTTLSELFLNIFVQGEFESYDGLVKYDSPIFIASIGYDYNNEHYNLFVVEHEIYVAVMNALHRDNKIDKISDTNTIDDLLYTYDIIQSVIHQTIRKRIPRL